MQKIAKIKEAKVIEKDIRGNYYNFLSDPNGFIASLRRMVGIDDEDFKL